ncbi:hypothetical protein GCM10027020_31750 [Nocardioides salsibiostraticola]
MHGMGADQTTAFSQGGDVESRVEKRSRYATIALVGVLFLVSAFAVWSSQNTSAAASRAAVGVGLYDDYAAAATAVGAEESLERKYRLEPGADVEALFDQAVADFLDALARVRRDGNDDDRAFVEDILTKHESYLLAIDRLFRATDRGDTADALKIDNEQVDPAFGVIETAVLRAADRKHQQSLSQLAALQKLEGTTRNLTPVVFILGLFLAAALAAVTRGHRRLLQRLSDHHEGILDSVGEGVIGVDASGRVTFANPAASKMLGAEGDGLLSADSCDITCTDTHDSGHRCVLDLVHEAGSTVTRPNAQFARVDGSSFPVEVTAAPQQGPGSASGVVLVFRDTTERLAMARMQSGFISAVSHELRTPLTSIRGALELLNDGDTGELPPPASKMVGTALRGSERLTRLVSDIIDIERIQLGSFPLHLDDLDVRPLINMAVADLEILAAKSSVELVVTRTTGRARCDADRIVQTLVNLIGNAVKFSPPGTTVEICAETRGEFVQFAVADKGCGIPESHLDSIFERFHQVDDSSVGERAGTGLGLAITRSIVEQHGGRIWVDSLPDRGSTFRFTIPCSGEN